jgi:hypothetical protein
MTAMDSVAAKLKEYEYLLKLQMAKIEELAAENETLRSSLGAHGVLKLVYSDNNQPAGVRVKAAQAALNVEKPRLESVPPPLDLTAEKYEPLADIVTRQRARMHRMWAEDPQFTGLRNSGYLPNGDGNSGDGQDGNSGDNNSND